MSAPRPEDLIDRYLAGELSPEAAAEVRAYLDATPWRRGVMAGVRSAARSEELGAPPSVDTAHEEFLVRLGSLIASQTPASQERETPGQAEQPLDNRFAKGGVRSGSEAHWTVSRALPRALWYSLAAIVIAVAGIVIGWHAKPLHFGSNVHAPAMATYVTGNGQRASITLTDGTIVALDVASRLEVPADYPTGNHALHLQGAALFTVAHHEGTPVTVQAGGITARVLGTNFVMRHYSTDTSTTVAVHDGKVAVKSVVVTAAQQATVSQTGIIHLQSIDPTQFAFATGVLTFSGVPLATAIPDLDRWYDADIRLGDPSLATRHVAGDYAAGSIANLVNYLNLTFNVRVVRNGRVLTLYPK